MRRGSLPEENTSEDSFLDVVANVVGVLIILVMLVGIQASRQLLAEHEAPSSEQPTQLAANPSPIDTAALKEELEEAAKAFRKSEQAVQNIATRIARISHEANAYDQQRIQLAMHRSVLEEDIERRKQQLDAERQQEYEVQRQLTESKLDLSNLMQEKLNAVSAASETITEIECVPTPLAKTVEGESIHLCVRKGQVSIVPFDDLLAEVEYNLEGIRRRLQENGRTVETFGPLDGYRLKFSIVKQNSPAAVSGTLAGQVYRASYDYLAELMPTSAAIGQNVEQALLPNGTVFRHLQSNRRQRPTVVVWLYNDSFDEFRPLKRKIWEMGFSLATRTLTPGQRIAASPRGTRSAAQ